MKTLQDGEKQALGGKRKGGSAQVKVLEDSSLKQERVRNSEVGEVGKTAARVR